MPKRTCAKCGSPLGPGALRCSNGHFQKLAKRKRLGPKTDLDAATTKVELGCSRCQITFEEVLVAGDVCIPCPKCHREIPLLDSQNCQAIAKRRGYQRIEDQSALKTTLGWQVMAVSQAIHTLLFAVGSFWTVEAFARGLSDVWSSLGPLGPGGHVQMLAASTMMSSAVALIFLLLTVLMSWGAYALWGIETFGRAIAITAQVLIDVPLALWLASRLSGRFDETIVAAPFLCLVSTYLLVGSDEIEVSWTRFTVGVSMLVLAHLVLIAGVITTFA